MNLFSFTDELMKLGAMDPLVRKHASIDSAPVGMVGTETMPPSDSLRPDEAGSRLPRTGRLKPAIVAGSLGPVGAVREPIDQPERNPSSNAGSYR